VRKVIIAIAFLALICQAEAMHQRFAVAEQSDEWLHEFFGKFLNDFEGCLRSIAKSETRVNESEKIKEDLETVSGEIEFYKARGVDTNASIAIKPFLTFSRNLAALAKAQEEFLNEMRNLKEGKGNYQNVAEALSKAKSSIEEMRKCLQEIDAVVFYSNTTALYFNTSAIRELLDEVEELFEIYEGLAKAYEVDGIWVFVSKNDPVLFERIFIWIYARNVTPTDLFIDEKRFEPKKMEYSFETLGRHFIYAKGIKGSEIVTSNVVEVNVKKIPTYIFLSSSSAFIGEEAEVIGLILDYHGARMSVPLSVFIDGMELPLESREGIFSIKLRKDYECTMKVEAFYRGNETHEEAYAEEIVYFLRFPVWIRLESNKQRVLVGEEVVFLGAMSESLPIDIIVNSEKRLKLNAGKNFSFSLNFSAPGRYEVYARFPGDELRRAAESNRIEIAVLEPFLHRASQWADKNYLMLIAFLAAFIASAFTARIFLNRGKRIYAAMPEKKEEIRTEEKKEEREIERKPEKSFKELFDALIKKFGLKTGLTPRELLSELGSQRFADKLKELVELHEKFAYAGIMLSKEEEEKFFKLVSEILAEL